MNGQASATKGPGPSLHRYPYLVHAPQQWGDFVATEDRGIPASTLGLEVLAGKTQEQVAAAFGTTVDHVRDAVRYLEDLPR